MYSVSLQYEVGQLISSHPIAPAIYVLLLEGQRHRRGTPGNLRLKPIWFGFCSEVKICQYYNNPQRKINSIQAEQTALLWLRSSTHLQVWPADTEVPQQ